MYPDSKLLRSLQHDRVNGTFVIVCGIFGIVDARRSVDAELVRIGNKLQRHRGPDGEGVWVRAAGACPAVAFGHRRLAIIDLSKSAAQPMASADGALHITYNGEIYNYVELMRELKGLGHAFRTASDTEVILAAYAEWGPRCLDRLNGMFAFAIWDERAGELFAARDRFGEKPFHYALDPEHGVFAFSSEIKPLLALPWVDATVDDRSLYRFIAFNELAGSDQTLWRGVRRLPHAHRLRVCMDGAAARLDVSVTPYWSIDLDRTSDVDERTASREFAELFADSVRMRLRSDVPVGSSLSGGLDSSAVVCQIHALGAAAGQQAFTARMEVPELDEGVYVRAVLDRTGVCGHEVWPSAEALRDGFSRACYHLEEPFLSTSQFAQHLVMRLASEHGVTVLLDGQGADELLAGYRAYFLTRYADLADRRRLGALWREWRGFRARRRDAFPLTARMAGSRIAPEIYRLRRRLAPDGDATPTGLGSWFKREWLHEFAGEAASKPPSSSRDALTRKLFADAFGGPLQELLRYGDRNSMAWSREVRQPFLDHRIAEMLFALPPEYKLRNGETKIVMRSGLKDLIPRPILDRQDKLGYQAPLTTWINGALKDWSVALVDHASSVLGERIATGAQERLARDRGVLSERDAAAAFRLATIGETLARMAGVRSDSAAPSTAAV